MTINIPNAKDCRYLLNFVLSTVELRILIALHPDYFVWIPQTRWQVHDLSQDFLTLLLSFDVLYTENSDCDNLLFVFAVDPAGK